MKRRMRHTPEVLVMAHEREQPGIFELPLPPEPCESVNVCIDLTGLLQDHGAHVKQSSIGIENDGPRRHRVGTVRGLVMRMRTSSVPRRVFIMMQPLSATSTSRSSCSAGPFAVTSTSTAEKRAGASVIVPLTSIRTSEMSVSRALIAPSRLLMKQPP